MVSSVRSLTATHLRGPLRIRHSSTTPWKLGPCTVRPAVRLLCGPAPVGMTTLISFDVDGTLIRSTGKDSNKIHKLAFAHGFKQVYDLDTNIDVIKHHGSTDPLILVGSLMHHGIAKEEAMGKLPELEAAMNAYFGEHVGDAGLGLEVLPGVKELLKALKAREDVLTCLVTGNLEPIGWGKMRALGLLDYFSEPRFGGFGSDHCSGNTLESWRDREELVRIAASRARSSAAGSVSLARRFHIGDTPMDLQAAEGAGAQGVGVTTGVYTREELKAVSPEAPILDGLKDLPAVLAIFGLQ